MAEHTTRQENVVQSSSAGHTVALQCIGPLLILRGDSLVRSAQVSGTNSFAGLGGDHVPIARGAGPADRVAAAKNNHALLQFNEELRAQDGRDARLLPWCAWRKPGTKTGKPEKPEKPGTDHSFKKTVVCPRFRGFAKKLWSVPNAAKLSSLNAAFAGTTSGANIAA